MRFLRQNTACRVTVGPFLDKGDGITPETALTVTGEKLTFMVDDGNVPTLVLDTAPTASAGNNDMAHVTNDDAGFYDLELTAANTNYVGRAMISLNDVATHCPVFHEFMILPQKVYDSLILGTDNIEADAVQLLGTAWTAPATAGLPDCNVKQISADGPAADNLEAACDGGTYNVGGGAVVAASVTTKTGYALAADQAVNVTKVNGTTQTAGDLAALITAIDTIIDTITAHIQADYTTANKAALDALTDGGRLDLIMDGIAAKTVNLPASPANEATLTTLHGHIDDIIADTAEIQAELADGGRTDLLIDAIKTVVDANGVKLVAVQGKTDMLPAVWFSS